MNLIEELYALQSEHGHLRDGDLRELSARIRTPLYEIEGVASFYPHFRRTRAPRATVTACRDLVCCMADGGAGLRALRELCDGRKGVEFHEVSCLGRCDGAPACTVNDVPTDVESVAGILDDPETLPSIDPTTAPRRWPIDPYASAEERYGVLKEYLASRELDGLVERLKQSGLRGMGGAGFPTGLKWELVRKESEPVKYVVCNADESEPGTFKDRVIMEELPWLVVEGVILGALTIGANEGWVYVRHEYGKERKAIEASIRQAYDAGILGDDVLGSGWSFHLKVFTSPGGYILGEETALLEALEGRRGEPRNKPPYPGTRGLFGKPTLINNVESFCTVPHLLRGGVAGHKFFCVSGDVETPGVHCAPKGTTLNDLIALCGGVKEGRELQAFLPGGASTGFLPASRADIVMDWEELQAAGSSLGSGAVVIVGEGRDMLAMAHNLTAFFRNESCGKCVPCRIGTQKAAAMIEGRRAEDLALIPELHETLRETSICGLGQAALNPILSVLDHFRTKS